MSSFVASVAIARASAARAASRHEVSSRAVVAAAPVQCAGRQQLAMSVANRRQLSGPSVSARAAGRAAAGAKGRQSRLAVSASADAAPAEEGKESGGASKQLVLVGLFIIWYLSNIAFNIWNKQLLKIYSFPMTGTFIQLGIGSVLAILSWVLRIKSPPKVSSRGQSGHLARGFTRGHEASVLPNLNSSAGPRAWALLQC